MFGERPLPMGVEILGDPPDALLAQVVGHREGEGVEAIRFHVDRIVADAEPSARPQ